MKYLLYLLLILFPLGQLGRLNILNSEIVFHLNDIVVGLIAAVWLFSKHKQNSLLKPLIYFLIAAFISLIANIQNFSGKELLIASLYPLRFGAYGLLFFAVSGLKSPEKKIIKPGLIMASVIIAVAGFIQYIFIPDTRFLTAYNWDDHYFRLISTFLDPGITGTILALSLVLLFFQKKLLLPVIYFAMALTYARASYLVYLVVFAVISFYQKSLKIFLVATLILAITIPLLPKTFGEGTNLNRGYSFWGRINNWRETVVVWTKAPIFGVGFNTYRYIQNASSDSHAGAGADSSILLVLATSGIPGLVTFLYLLKKIWDQTKSPLFRVTFIGIFVSSWFNNTLLYPFVLEWLWLLLATENT
ncbi:MAG: O-antigen ligase family protein [Patescibacteria group bacterium]